MVLYRGAAATAATAVGALAAYFGTVYPWLAPVLTGLATGAGTLIGKWLGIPIDGVLSAALATMTTDRAVAVTAQALRSMPPSAASTLLGSLPPPAPIAISFVDNTHNTCARPACGHKRREHWQAELVNGHKEGCVRCDCSGFTPYEPHESEPPTNPRVPI